MIQGKVRVVVLLKNKYYQFSSNTYTSNLKVWDLNTLSPFSYFALVDPLTHVSEKERVIFFMTQL